MKTRSQKQESPRKTDERRLKNSRKNCKQLKKRGAIQKMSTPDDGQDNLQGTVEVQEGIPNEEEFQPLYSPSKHKAWAPKIGTPFEEGVVRLLKQHLPATVITLFKKTMFRHFIECPTLKVYPQLLHRLIKEELQQPNPEIIKIRVQGMELDFKLEDFIVISGLPAVPKDNFELIEARSMSVEAKQFCDRYLSEYYPSIRKEDLETVIKSQHQLNLDTVEAEACLKIALVYFISYFILGSDPASLVPRHVINCVVNGTYNKAAWGRLSYNALISSLKKEGGIPGSYRFKGCPAIYQIWFFEVCGACEGFLAERRENESNEFRLRIFNWDIYTSEVSQKDLDKYIFKKDRNEVNLCPFTPTPEESEKLLNWKNENQVEGENAGFGVIDRTVINETVKAFQDNMNTQFGKMELQIGKWNVKLESLQRRVAGVEVNKECNETGDPFHKLVTVNEVLKGWQKLQFP